MSCRPLTLLDTTADAEDPAAVREQELLALFQLFFGMRPILGTVKPLLFGPGFLADPASAELVGIPRGRGPGQERIEHGPSPPLSSIPGRLPLHGPWTG